MATYRAATCVQIGKALEIQTRPVVTEIASDQVGVCMRRERGEYIKRERERERERGRERERERERE